MVHSPAEVFIISSYLLSNSFEHCSMMYIKPSELALLPPPPLMEALEAATDPPPVPPLQPTLRKNFSNSSQLR